MEFRLFGRGDFPPHKFHRDVEMLVSLDERQLGIIANWFLTTDDFDSDAAVSSPLVVASALTPDQVVRSVETLQFILEAWYLHSLTLEDIQRDLMLMGTSSERITRLGALLQRLGPIREKAYAGYMRDEHENAVLPTLEDVSFVCDLRPIFEDEVDLFPDDTRTVRHTRILGVTQVVLAELLTEDSGGKKRRVSFQMGEQALDDLQSALKRAREQLDILKANISVSQNSK